MTQRDKLIKVFLEKNKQINLSAIRDQDGVMLKHIQDSLELEKIIDWEKGMKVADVGTGGGFPLMPLAICHPECSFVGIDSVKKKTVAVGEILGELGVENVELLWSRIEDIKDKSFDLVTARAVAYADQLLNWITPLVKKGGRIALMKQVNEEEKSVILNIAKNKKLTLESEHSYKLFDGDIDRIIYILKK